MARKTPLGLEHHLDFIRGASSVADLTEEFLIQKLESKNRWEAWAATIALQEVGTKACVEPLKICCVRPIQDLQIASIYTLRVIAGAEIAEFAAGLLGDKRYRQKWAAMLACCEFCGSQHRPALEKRVKQVTGRQRAAQLEGAGDEDGSEVLAYLRYLDRTHQKIGELRALLLRRREKLTEEEVAAVKAFS